jgi:hypothetical protein
MQTAVRGASSRFDTEGVPWPLKSNYRKTHMEVSRLTFRTMIYESIRAREKFEREELGYTMDSAHLAMMRQMLEKTEYNESTIHLRD